MTVMAVLAWGAVVSVLAFLHGRRRLFPPRVNIEIAGSVIQSDDLQALIREQLKWAVDRNGFALQFMTPTSGSSSWAVWS